MKFGMKKLLVGCFWMWMAIQLSAQTADALLMRVAGREVMRSEFEYAYRKNNLRQPLPVSQFVDLFVRGKLQVCEAEKLGLDTLPAFVNRLKELNRQVEYNGGGMEVVHDGREVTKLLHMYVYLPQHASYKTIQNAKNRMEKAYRSVQSGTPFEKVVAKCVADSVPQLFAETVVFPKHHSMAELERQVNSLQVGEVAAPFLTPVGVHLIQVLDRFEMKPQTERKEASADAKREEAYLLAEYREMLLQEALEQYEPLMTPTEAELNAYFKKHKNNYAWQFPHFKGCVLQCKDKSSAKAIEKQLKKQPMNQWVELLQHYNDAHPDKAVKAVCGLFELGTHAVVDKVAFGQGFFVPEKDYPYVCAVGKRLKKGPKHYTDVRERLVADYLNNKQAEREQAWKEKYKVEINQEVLKTVNNH